MLDEFRERIEEVTDVQVLFEHLSERLKSFFDAAGMVIYTVDENFDFVPGYMFPARESGFFSGVLEKLVDSGMFASVLEESKTSVCVLEGQFLGEREIRSVVLSPLKVREDVLGMVCIYSHTSSGEVSVESIEALSRLVRLASRSFLLARSRKKIDRLRKKVGMLETYKDNVFAHITDCVMVVDGSGTIREINRAGVKLFGIARNELVGKQWVVLFTRESSAVLAKVLKKISSEGEVRNVEMEIKNRFGDVVPVNFSGGVHRDLKGKEDGYVAVLKDITEIRGLIRSLENATLQIEQYNIRLEEKIQSRTRELKEKINEIKYLSEFNLNILENINSGVIGLDAQLKVNTFNRAASNITGIEPFDVIGKNLALFDSLKSLADLARKSLAMKKNIAGQERGILHPSRREVSVSVSSSILYTPLKEVRGVMLVFADITIIREMHQKVLDSERMAALGRMSAGVAHEIRNPMNVIRGLAEIILTRDVGREKTNKYISVIISQIDRLECLLKQIVDFIKSAPPRLRRQNLVDVVKTVLETFREGFLYFSEKEIELQFDAQRDIPEVYIDEDRVQQIVFNLLKNSVDAIEDAGNIDVRIFMDDASVVLEVKDDGCGMDESVREHALEAFFTTKMTQGTGLGLSIVKNIMEGHKGTIEIASGPGEGTSIHLKFPKEKRGRADDRS
jgi:PAS domain S-box-containing protein